MARFFSWKDVENELLLNSDKWPNNWSNIEVYSNEIIVYSSSNTEKDDAFLKSIFGRNYNIAEKTISLDVLNGKLEISYENAENNFNCPKSLPLFQNIFFENKIMDESNLPQPFLGVPVIAFHSYKGGVGRTLSLLAVARELSAQINSNYKVLIIDADVEAPGLTWLARDSNLPSEISYLDMLSIMHDNEYSSQMVKEIASIVEKSSLRIETEGQISEHYFVPVYREPIQVLNLYAHPEKIVKTVGKEFIIPDFFSNLGKELGVSAVLVDLRAGLSEFSAPFLFDPRVKKFYVTSTSMQSIQGTKLILDQVSKEPITENNPKPTILLTMVPDQFDDIVKNDILSEFVEYASTESAASNADDNSDALLGDFIIEIPFYSELIHLGGLNQIIQRISETGLKQKTRKIVDNMFIESIKVPDKEKTSPDEILSKLHQLAENEITAEGVTSSKMLATESLQNLVRKYRDSVPNVVILGAKGSGKTFVYKQLLKNKTWEKFGNEVQNTVDKVSENETLIFPILSSGNRSVLSSLLKECIQNINSQLSDLGLETSQYNQNSDKINAAKLTIESEIEWKSLWKTIILDSFKNKFQNFKEIDDYLETHNRRVILMVDGLEDVFNTASLTQSEKNAVKSLCQGIINDINDFEYRNLGMIIFLRRDIAENSITSNYTQFYQQYSAFELKWTQTEALRLALWLVCQVAPKEFNPQVPVEKASRELIDDRLAKLWGLKLGKPNSNEAFSSRWILAALSDFNGQLQARDIIRFLKHATISTISRPYNDRLIMPSEIKNAIGPCSEEKREEVIQEIQSIGPIFNKFQAVPASEKFLPFDPDVIKLTPTEKAILQQQGYLKIYKEQYYLPEIIRHALEYKYQKGARPKVLSLLIS